MMTNRNDNVPDRNDPDPPEAPDEVEVRRWVESAVAGEVDAFESLYRSHAGRVYALCLRMAGDPAEAEELAQEAFIRAWKRLRTFRGESAFSSWLHRLTVNVVLGRFRARGRYRDRVVPIEDLPAVVEPIQRTTGGLAMDLERAISDLPQRARTVFVLYEIEGWKHHEIADETGVAVGTSKTQLHRARQLLRAALQTSDETSDQTSNRASDLASSSAGRRASAI